MRSSKKHTFYPEEVVEIELNGIPRGKLSERINQLILKGLETEKQESIALAYQKYNSELAPELKRNFRNSSVKIMSENAFVPEDEVEDFV